MVSRLSQKLSSEFDVSIVLFGAHSEITYPYSGRVIYLDRRGPRHTLDKILTLFLRVRQMKSILRGDANSIVISFLEYPNLINLLTPKGCKTIVSVRNHMSTQYTDEGMGRFWNATIRLLYGRADRIIAVSKEVKRDLISEYGLPGWKITVLYNSYPLQKITELSQEEVDDKHRWVFEFPVIISVGRLVAQKGQWHLIRAFARVKREVPKAKLVILGEGNLKDRLQRLARELGVSNDVHFLGFQRNPFKYVARSRVFVLSSLYEGFPNALAEAMACGIPVVSSDCPSGPREILAPGEFGENEISYKIDPDRYGVLVPVCDGVEYGREPLIVGEKVMADSIVRLLGDQHLWGHFARQSLARIRVFDIERSIVDWRDIVCGLAREDEE